MKVSIGCERMADGGTLYVIPYQRQLELDQLQEAIAASRTWADFLFRAPAWAAAMMQTSLEASVQQEGERLDFSGIFDVSAIPGFDEGDFPPFACYETAGTLPEALAEKYGVWIGTVLNGDYLQISPANGDDLIAELERQGWEVTIHNSFRPN